MTPTYANTDIKKIASYLQISTDEMKRRWLKKERGTGNWINKTTPCQFLDQGTNMCNVYEVRPADPVTFVSVSIALIGVAIVAGALPAYRATRVSPLVALRTE